MSVLKTKAMVTSIGYPSPWEKTWKLLWLLGLMLELYFATNIFFKLNAKDDLSLKLI
jgi:hypothetical protein